MAIAYNPKMVTGGLVLCLDAANPKSYPGSGATWTDLTGNGNNVTLVNSPTYNSAQGFMSFNGSTQRGTTIVPAFNSGTQAYTFEVLFKMRTLPTAEYGVNGHIWGGQNGNNIVLYVNPAVDGQSTLNMIHDDSRYVVTGAVTNGTILANSWTHWIVSWDSPAYTFNHYLNGVMDKQGLSGRSGQEARTWSDGTIAFDSRWNTHSTLDIAIMKQYNRVLSAAEALNNFQAIRGRFGI